MEYPSPSEQYITIIDNRGREQIQSVEYIVTDVKQEGVYVTIEGLTYTRDSLTFKEQTYLLPYIDDLTQILQEPDIVIWDPVDDLDETLIYYKRIRIDKFGEDKTLAVIVKIRQNLKFFYNLHLQESGKVKGVSVVPANEITIWYLAGNKQKSQFGL